MEKTLNPAPSSVHDTHLRRYCAMGVGTAVLAGTVTTMDASVVYTNYDNAVLADTNTSDMFPAEFPIDLNKDGTNDLEFFIGNQGAGNPGNYTLLTAGANGAAAPYTIQPLNLVGFTLVRGGYTYGYASRLKAGVSVGPSQNFITITGTSGGNLEAVQLAVGSGGANSQFAKPGANTGFLGLSFDVDGELHYGFLELSVAPNTGADAHAITLIGSGYETDPNTPIITVDIPEPSSLALLAAGGAGGIMAFRRRRKAAEPAGAAA